MCGDVLSCARVESDGDCLATVCADAPTAPHAGGLAVKPDGTSTNRTADAGIAAREQTTRSSPAGHRKIFPKSRLGADPRALPGRPLRLRPLPLPAARAPAADTGNSGGDGTRGPLPSSAMPGWHAKHATALPPADRPDCNISPAATGAQRTARIPSAGSGVASAHDKSLATEYPFTGLRNILRNCPERYKLQTLSSLNAFLLSTVWLPKAARKLLQDSLQAEGHAAKRSGSIPRPQGRESLLLC